MGEKKRRITSAATLLQQAQEHHHAGRIAEAKTLYEQSLRLEPSNATAWFGLGLLARQAGAGDPAIQLLARAAELAPDNPDHHLHFAQTLQDKGYMEKAVVEFEQVCHLLPHDAQAWERLGIARQSIGDIDGARTAYIQAIGLEPGNAGARLKLATLISPVICSPETLFSERNQIEAAIDTLLRDPLLRLGDPIQAALWSNFYLAFHGENNCVLQKKYATLYQAACPALSYVAPHCNQPRQATKRLRIGLISNFFFNHSIGRTSRGLIAQLPQEELEITAIFVAPVVDDEYSRFIRQHAEHSLVIPKDLPEARNQIAALHLDVLFYQDIGMEPFTYFLAYSRLAPVQCVSFGHPDTTGIPTMDYFISNDLYELPDAHEHYSERLFLLRDLGTLAYYYPPQLPPQRKRRKDFGLSEEDPLYICPQNLFKFHPDMDSLIAQILRRDTRGKLVVIEGRIKRWTDQLIARWRLAMPDVIERIVFLSRQESTDYVNLIALSDVMLDTVHFNGMNTSLEAFSVGTPVVTLPGRFQRGRHTQAMYRKMGLPDCIATTPENYIELAVRLANDSQFRSETHNRIVQRSSALFEDSQAVSEFARFFREAIAQTGHRISES